MKKFLCLVLTLAMVLSCISLTAFAKGEQDNLYRPDGTDGHEDIVGKIIDPILKAKDTVFADSINELGYASVNAYAASGKNITKATFNSFITANAADKMIGVDFDFLYSKNSGPYFWTFSNYALETELTETQMRDILKGISSVVSVITEWKIKHPGQELDVVQKFIEDWQASNPGKDYNIHDVEMYAAEKEGRRSTCALKGAYDACAEVLDGYRYDYTTKSVDKDIFDDIIETKIVYRNNYNKRDEIHYNYSYDLTKGNFALVRANANNQIINTICKVWNSDALFTNKAVATENAIKIANFIGKLFYPNFTEIPANRVVFTDNKRIDAYDFFAKVTEISGLDKILEDYWCNQSTFEVREIMYAFGVNVSDNVLLNIETEKGVYMGARILTDMFRNFYKNPVLYVENLIQMFCKGYSYSYQRAIESIFTIKYSSMYGKSYSGNYPLLDKYTGNELKSVDGLLNFIADCLYVNNVDAGNKNATKFSFAPLPVNRFATATDADELHLYYLCYLELNRIYENNTAIIENFISGIIAKLRPAYAQYKADQEAANSNNQNNKDEEEAPVVDPNKDMVAETEQVLRSLFLGELTMVDIFSFHLETLTQNTIDNFSNNFMSNIKNAIANLFQKFIDAMDSFMNLLFGWTGGILG